MATPPAVPPGLRWVKAAGARQWQAAAHEPEDPPMQSALTARDLMTPDVVSVPPDTAVVAVARLLAERGISAVPVLDKAGAVRPAQ